LWSLLVLDARADAGMPDAGTFVSSINGLPPHATNAPFDGLRSLPRADLHSGTPFPYVTAREYQRAWLRVDGIRVLASRASSASFALTAPISSASCKL
jgi:hypothetical protein